MTATTGKQYGLGFRYAVLFALNSSGSPAATDTTAYEGVQAVGAKTFNLNIPDPQKFTHVGDDSALQVDYLPSTEAVSADLTVAQDNNDVYALVTNTNEVTIGEKTIVGIGTSQQGSESQVTLLAYQQSLDENGVRNYRWFLIPKATLYPKPGGLGPNPAEHGYTVSPTVVSAYPWETAFASGTEGFITTQILKGQAVYKPKLVAWLSATATTEFDLPSDTLCADTGKMNIWVDGVEQTEDITKATDSVQFTTAPGNAKRVVCFYEHE